MTRSYDFLIRAYRVPAFREEIISHINSPNSSEMIYEFAVLKFEPKDKMIREFPNTGVFLANKVIPMEISFDGFFRIMNSKEPWLICDKECKFLE